jgi:probable rRNA maturation factor
MRRTKPPPKIAIRNRQRLLRLDLHAIRHVVREAWCFTIDDSRFPIHELSVAFVTDAEIARLNKQFLRHSGPTDVITFEHGEIVICTERAVAQAKEYRTSVAEELALYVIHGLLHLAGYDDRAAATRRAMHRRQRAILFSIRKKLDLENLLR